MPLLSALMISVSLAHPGSSTGQVDQWGLESGLPQSSVTAVVPTQDGRLWLGTFAGVALFDGERADPVVVDAERPLRVTALVADEQGLWVGTESEGLWRLEGGHFTQEPVPLAPWRTITDLVPTDQGLWLSTRQGVRRRWRWWG